MSANTERYEFLDWLRVIAIFVLLFFHTGMLFVGWGWHITNAETIPALQMPMDIAHRLRMPFVRHRGRGHVVRAEAPQRRRIDR
jgi:glucans biosynthesis protein C